MSFALLCFVSTFVAVFALGLQSLNVNQGHYWAAAGTSVLISLGHIGLYKYMPGADALAIAGYLAGGVCGITASMWSHRRVRTWWAARSARRVPPGPVPQAAPRPKAPPPMPRSAHARPACPVCGAREGEGCPRLLCERFDEHADVNSLRLH